MVNARPRLLDLPHGHQAVIDEADWPAVRALTLYRGTNGYVYYSIWGYSMHGQGKSQPRTLHSFLKYAPPGFHIDHINGDKLDNRRANLRVVSPSRNQVNRKRLNKNNRSGVRGVDQAFGKWRAQITVDRTNHYLGLFENKDDAIAARRQAELQYFGELCPDPAS